MPPQKSYHLSHKSFPGHYEVTDTGRTVLYYVETHSMRSPDMVVHQGKDKSGPVVGVLDLVKPTRTRVGMGNPDDPHRVVWEEIEMHSGFSGASFMWGFNMAHGSGERRLFNWKSPGVLISGYELVEDETDAVVARLKPSSTLGSSRDLEFELEVDPELHFMVLLTSLAATEMLRRRSAHANHSPVIMPATVMGAAAASSFC